MLSSFKTTYVSINFAVGTLAIVKLLTFNEPPSSSKKRIIFIVLLVVFLVAAAFGVYYLTHTHTYKMTVIAEPSCLGEGTTNYICWCSDEYNEHPSALGHAYEAVVTKEVTCIEPGTNTFTCSRCKDAYEEEISATGHNFIEEIKDAECEGNGYIRNTCSQCGEVNEEDIPALEHDYEMTETDTEKVFTCALCEDSYSEQKPKKKSAPADPTVGKTGGNAYTPEQTNALLQQMMADGMAPVTDVMQSSGVAHVDRETSVDISGVTLH